MATHCYSGVVAGPAGDENKSPTPLDLFDVVLQSTQRHWRENQTQSLSFQPTVVQLS